MKPFIISNDAAKVLAALLEQAANQHATKHLAAYHLRVLSSMLRETPEEHSFVLDPVYQHDHIS